MNRRDFLIAAAGSAGYSLFINATDVLAATPPAPPPSRDDITKSFDLIAPPNPQRRDLQPEPHMTLVDLSCDLFIAGGGLAGVCAAVAAARNGAKVVLVQDRSRLGGNSSSEVKMHVVGADCHGGRAGWRESGLIEEFRLDDAANNPHRSWELWDLMLYDKVRSERNITLLLDSVLFAADVKDNAIQQVMVRCDKSEHLYRVTAKLFMDCTGDSRLAVEAGAEWRWGRETKKEFNESLGLDEPDRQTLGSSILFTSRDYGRPIPFTPPKWARKVTKEMLRFRPVGTWEYGYWWIEWGGQLDTVRDNERIRFELLSIVMGVWDYIKNSGDHPSSANWGMDWVGAIPGKRESRRIMGDYVLTQNDCLGFNPDPDDAVAIGGWPLDDHPPSGFDKWDQRPYTQVKCPEPYNIPLRCLYSRDISNLMMAGRNISASHVAFTSSRVMATCATIGQAAGTAAALCIRHDVKPRALYQDKEKLLELQQTLLRDDQTIRNRKNIDPTDLARTAKVTASSEFASSKAAHVINGLTRDLPEQWSNRWGASMTPDGAWLELAWDKPQKLSHVQITFDSGFSRELTLTSSDTHNKKCIRAPQPETARDYRITYKNSKGNESELVTVRGNHQRLNRHHFAAVEAQSIRMHITNTNGSDTARIYEVRCYA